MADRPRIAWVTGGSSGIGLAIARALGEAGYGVVISARDEARLREACATIPGSAFIVADMTDRPAVQAAAQTILDRHGRIDVLVNNAGFNVRQRSWEDLVPEEFDAVLAANLTGAFNAIHAVLPAMRAQRSGHVVSISSVAGKQVSLDGGVAYTVAKHGVHVLSRLLQQSEQKHGIKVSVISPGGVSTRAHDWRPQEVRAYMLAPEDVARAVRFITEAPPNTAIFDIELSWAPA
ncbi:MAG TPA: SDR family oxidoreductase [Novosphingobium sp.]|nr:SDR family oxidoreductase [Novosphingobium sp.]HMP55430.1 SDR family oxidoreductase [Novosphingobium sp.]